MRYGFTLIELLVVVTIIVVLLALLTPALDRAIYKAELTADAANIKGIGTALGIYAMQNGRQYPYRYYASGQSDSSWWPQWIARPGTDLDDVRRMLHDIVGYKSYNDPLGGGADFDPVATAGSQVLGNYPIWGGFAYLGNKGMKRIGDRLEWTYAGTGGQSVTESFELLVSDWDLRWDGSGAEGSHADDAGIMHHTVEQNHAPIDTGPTGNSTVDATAFGNWTLSRWIDLRNQAPPRGLVDQNYGYQDGSSKLLERMQPKWEDDDRLTLAPLESNAANRATLNLQVPKR